MIRKTAVEVKKIYIKTKKKQQQQQKRLSFQTSGCMDTCQIKVCSVNQVLTDDGNLSITFIHSFPKEDKSYIPQCNASNYIIKLARTRDPFISNGRAVEERANERQRFSAMLYLYSLDTEYIFEVTLSDWPFLLAEMSSYNRMLYFSLTPYFFPSLSRLILSSHPQNYNGGN